MLAWIPFLIYYFYWLLKKKPHQRSRTYVFENGRYMVICNRW